ncbi:hypothetical protein [Gordonibacter sp.]|uniref:hypothetical protein n=1 Tax=Gordonibacter sp. TaxID=1968902 RepID=UPI002FCA8366
MEDSIARAWCGELSAALGIDACEGNFSSKKYSNSVAYHVDQTAHAVVRYLFSGKEHPSVSDSIDGLCRLLALQDSSPQSTFSSFFKLRSLIFSNSAKLLDAGALQLIDARIDTCALCAIDCYVRCRDQIMRLRMDELKRSTGMLERYRSESRVGERVG